MCQECQYHWSDNVHDPFVFACLFVDDSYYCCIVAVEYYMCICQFKLENVDGEEYWVEF